MNTIHEALTFLLSVRVCLNLKKNWIFYKLISLFKYCFVRENGVGRSSTIDRCCGMFYSLLSIQKFVHNKRVYRLCIFLFFFSFNFPIQHSNYQFLFLFTKQDIQFKSHSKYQLFNSNASTPNHNGIDLLVTASAFGLIIVGRPSSKQIEGNFCFWRFSFHFFFCLFLPHLDTQFGHCTMMNVFLLILLPYNSTAVEECG